MIIIPAYNPTDIIKELIVNLKQNGYSKIIVINDGSENTEIFKKIQKDTIILTHDENSGKGKALKTGFEYCLNNLENIKGVITVDADGQHLVKDINKVYKKLLECPKCLIIGSRTFKQKNVPLRSFIGNKIIDFIFEKKTKVKINDTQTGLRAIPSEYLEQFSKIEGKRYEYETHMLIYAIKNKIKIIEEEIERIYLNNNETSKFKIIKDSLKIVKMLIKL